MRRALAIRKAAAPGDLNGTAWLLQGLGDLYLERRRHLDAESVLTEALALRRTEACPDHPHAAAGAGDRPWLSIDGPRKLDTLEHLMRRSIGPATARQKMVALSFVPD